MKYNGMIFSYEYQLVNTVEENRSNHSVLWES